MKSLKDKINDEKWGGKNTREAIPLIYRSLKKRKLYNLFKLNYMPLSPLKEEQERRVRLGNKEIYISRSAKKNDYVFYKPFKDGIYTNTVFHKYAYIRELLHKCWVNVSHFDNMGPVNPDVISEYILQDYFDEYVKNHKIYINELFFCFLFGTIGMVLGMTMLFFLIKIYLTGFLPFFSCYFLIVFFIAAGVFYVQK